MVFDPLQIILSSDGFSLSYIDLTVSAGAFIAYTLGSSPIETLYTPGSDGQNMTLHGSDPRGLWEGFLAPFPFVGCRHKSKCARTNIATISFRRRALTASRPPGWRAYAWNT
jgi:hypothetical protein